MIVCHCGVVSSRDITKAWDEGARSLPEVCDRTGAAKNCGTCVFSVRQVLCEHVQHSDIAGEETVRAAS
jgi:bacterioferritin-associated ferredoxin